MHETIINFLLTQFYNIEWVGISGTYILSIFIFLQTM